MTAKDIARRTKNKRNNKTRGKITVRKQRKRAALVAKFERSPVNFKFVSSHPKIVFFEANFGQKWSKVRVAVVRKVVVRFWKNADFAKSMQFP